MNTFVLVAIAVGLVIATLIGFRLTGLSPWSWVLAYGLVAIILLYPLIWFGSVPENLEAPLRGMIHFSMGTISIVLGLLILRDLIFLPAGALHPPLRQLAYARGSTLSLIAVSFALLGYGYWNASRGPELKTVNLRLKAISPRLSSFTIVQLSDLHAGAGIDRDYVSAVVDEVLRLDPTIVILTGDIADGKFEKFRSEAEPLRRLSTKPVFYVTGNHEFIKDSQLWIPFFDELGFKVLRNEHVIFPFNGEKILIAGVLDPEARAVEPADGPDVAKAIAGAEPAAFKVLLAPQPKVADEASPFFDLQLSGHTHAGQFFPWNFAIYLFQKYVKGLNQSGSMAVYVNTGTGF